MNARYKSNKEVRYYIMKAFTHEKSVKALESSEGSMFSVPDDPESGNDPRKMDIYLRAFNRFAGEH